MFAQRLAGQSVATIVRMLNEKGVFCPSEKDPQRNDHRRNYMWPLRSVASILANRATPATKSGTGSAPIATPSE